ncbi:four-carbon acid sugar kinase family protein [Betaproteobacteria bacterium LSUCC0117]|nr:four-carbon acid sugar kinase family protein [Betaproteobacteria bacterium LSUCC0117]
MTPLLGCIADDFTGATDLANNLVRAGMRTVQTIGVPESADAVFADAIVVALKSRTVPATAAVAQSLKAYQWLKAQGVSQIYFKYCSTFDSTPAGNIGPVTDALLDAIHGEGKGFTIVCPAFPENQRTIFNGHLFVGEQLLSDSGMRDHPLTPMTDANLVRVMQAQTKRRVGLVNYAAVSKGADAIKAAFQNLQDQGYGVAVVDAISNTDLMAMGAALAGMPLVTAGSGVAIGLPQNWRATGQLPPSDHADQLPPPSGYQAVISGSCSVATNQQVAVWRDAGLPALAIDPLGLANGTTTADAAADWARQHLPKGPVLVYATAAPEVVREIQAQLGVAAAGALVESALSGIAVSLIESGVRQLVVAGGETSGAVVQALAVERMAIGPQIDPGVPWTCVNAAAAGDQTVHVALKSGNFGTPDFFQKAFAALTPKSA